MVAAAVVLAVILGLGLSLTTGTHSTSGNTAGNTSGNTPQPSASAAGQRGTRPSASPSATSSSPSGHTPALVAARVRSLLAQEVSAHQNVNAAVGALLTCTNMAQNRQTISSFPGTRTRLTRQLAALPSTTSPRLDGIVQQLVGTWRSLTPVDRADASWARSVRRSHHHKCRAPVLPDTSQASKIQRRQLRDAWVGLLNAHPTWGVAQVGPLMSSPRSAIGYMLL